MHEKFDSVFIRDNLTLKESFELPLEQILNFDQGLSFKARSEKIDKLVKSNISNFDEKYVFSGGTNLRINETNYPFPVLTTKNHTSQFFPELLEYNGNVTINYHILTLEKN